MESRKGCHVQINNVIIDGSNKNDTKVSATRIL